MTYRKTAENKTQFIWDIVDSMVANGDGRYDWLHEHFSIDPDAEMMYYDERPVQSYAMDSLYGILQDLTKYVGEFV